MHAEVLGVWSVGEVEGDGLTHWAVGQLGPSNLGECVAVPICVGVCAKAPAGRKVVLTE